MDMWIAITDAACNKLWHTLGLDDDMRIMLERCWAKSDSDRPDMHLIVSWFGSGRGRKRRSNVYRSGRSDVLASIMWLVRIYERPSRPICDASAATGVPADTL